MAFWRCYYHVVWATKYREAIITPPLEQVILAAIEQKSIELGSVMLAANSAGDHVHVAASIPPAIAISKWVGLVKGASSRAVNIGFDLPDRFHWQESDGVMTFGEQALPMVTQYIASQKQRHATNGTNAYLE